MKTIPNTIGNCKLLISLSLFNNKLEELPQVLVNIFIFKEITSLILLEELNCSVNKLTILPRGFGAFNKLSFLDMSYNQLTEIPAQIGFLVTLREAHFSFNKLSKVPPEIGK